MFELVTCNSKDIMGKSDLLWWILRCQLESGGEYLIYDAA